MPIPQELAVAGRRYSRVLPPIEEQVAGCRGVGNAIARLSLPRVELPTPALSVPRSQAGGHPSSLAQRVRDGNLDNPGLLCEGVWRLL